MLKMELKGEKKHTHTHINNRFMTKDVIYDFELVSGCIHDHQFLIIGLWQKKIWF